MQNNLPQKKALLLDVILIPVVFLLILLLGYYGVFLGHNFITSEPSWQIYLNHTGNMNSSGWRPDLGLGLSYFFGDPGSSHVWALFRWWIDLFSNPITAYNASVIALLWAGCLAQFMFLRKAFPNLGRTISVFLACMVAFGPQGQHTFFIQSAGAAFLIAIPLICLTLYDFSIKPAFKHYFYYTSTLVMTVVFGCAMTFINSLIFSCMFFMVLVCFHKWHKNWTVFYSWLRRFVLLNLSCGLSVLVLAAWTFYSIFVENQASQYVRDPNYVKEHFFRVLIDVKFIFQKLMTYVQPDFLSVWSSVLGSKQILNSTGKNCFSILLPIIFFIALFHKSRNFWEFSFKCLFIGVLLYQELLAMAPGLINIFKYFRPPTNLSAVFIIFGILGLAICLSKVQSGEIKVSGLLSLLIRCATLPLCFVYGSLFMVALLSIHAPEFLNTLLSNMWGWIVPYAHSVSLKNLIPTLILENVRLFNETMGTSHLLYYGSAFIIMGLFSTRYGISFMKWKGGATFAGIVLAHQIFLSWAVYPMNSKPPVWIKQLAMINETTHKLSPTDRIMRVGRPVCRTSPHYFDCVKNKFIDRPFGPRRWTPGFMGLSPVLELSAPKTHTQSEVNEFINTLVKLDYPESKFPHGLNRALQTEPPFFSSKLYDIAGVKYLLSQDSLEETDRIKLAYSDRQFFLYRYLDSWPYFYLSDRIEIISKYEDLHNAEKGVAYLWEAGPEIFIPSRTQDSSGTVELALFEFGRMEFDYSSDQSEFLVISDAWHPNWKAQINGVDTEIVKVNGVFKGILLPPGKGRVHLHFDNSSYKPGIWISIAGWILFIGGWVAFYRRSRVHTTSDSLNLAN